MAIETERAARRNGIAKDLALLRVETGERRASIAKEIRELRPPPDEVVPALIASLDERDDNDEDTKARAAVAATLAAIAGPTQEAITAITRLLEDPNQIVRRTAAGLLGGFGPKAHEGVPARRCRRRFRKLCSPRSC